MPRKLLLLLWLWLAGGIAAAVALMLLQPEGLVKWCLWAVAIVPMGLLANAAVEGAAHFFMSLPGMKQGTRYFEKRAEGKEFSIARIAWYGLSTILGITLAVAVATAAWNGYSLARDFIAQDRCLDSGGQWKAEERKCQYQSGSAR
ncbi:hypothetical protein [Piscinibacter sp.]|uniref:hypothetical protein n=1 Tax=Piscinibacter sp. TaxID=1903157 RepID=UPI0039E2BC11